MKVNRLSLNLRPLRRRRFGPAWVRGTALAGLIWFAAGSIASADNTANSTNAPAAKVSAAQPAAKADKKSAARPAKTLSGVELYAIHCNRCHPERYPVELNETQWKTIMLHMRVRAGLPADQTKAIMKYLQEEAGN